MNIEPKMNVGGNNGRDSGWSWEKITKIGSIVAIVLIVLID